MTNSIFGTTASIETNYPIASNEIDRIFDANMVHCNELKHSTSDYSEQLKDYVSRINTATVPTRFQNIQRYQHSPQR